MEFGCALVPWQITRLVQTFGSRISLPSTPYRRPDYQAVIGFSELNHRSLPSAYFEKQAVVTEMNNRLRKSLGITKSSTKIHTEKWVLSRFHRRPTMVPQC